MRPMSDRAMSAMKPHARAASAPGGAIADAAPTEWRRVALSLGPGLLLLGVAFKEEVAAAVQTWINSTAYNHSFLVIPIATFLLWERRTEIARHTPAPAPWLALLGVPLALIWIVSERLGIMEGRQLAAVSFVQLLFLVVLGPQFWWAVSGPLLYLYFLVPFGAFLTPILQDFTTDFIQHGLAILGVPAYIDGNLIEIPQGRFLIAEACAGLRFLIASIAFGCLYALQMYRSPVRRAVFVLVSIIVPVIANGFRGLGIVYLGYLLGSAQAAAADHLIYGWLFFSSVILMLILVGLPFRQDERMPPPPPRYPSIQPPFVRPALVGVFGLVILAAIGPALSAGVTKAQPVGLPASLDLGPGCATLAGSPGDTIIPTLRRQRVACGDTIIDLTWEAFSPSATSAPVMLGRERLSQRLESESLVTSWLPATGDRERAWQIMQSSEPAAILAAAIWIDGRPVRPGLSMRFRMALSSLVGSPYAPIVMTATPAVPLEELPPPAREQAVASLLTFLEAHPDLDDRVGAMSALPSLR